MPEIPPMYSPAAGLLVCTVHIVTNQIISANGSKKTTFRDMKRPSFLLKLESLLDFQLLKFQVYKLVSR